MTPQVPERAEVEVAVATMPQPRLIDAARQKTDRAPGGERQHVEPPRVSPDMCEQPSIFITEPEHAVADVCLTPAFVHLSDADDIAAQSWYIVYLRQRQVFAIPTFEEDGASPLDLNVVAVTELH